MNILQEIILPIAPYIGILLFCVLMLFLLKSGHTDIAFFLMTMSSIIAVCVAIGAHSYDVDTKFGNLSQYAFSDIEDDVNGAEILGLDYKTSKVTLKLRSGDIKEYILTHYPVRITNPESVDESLSSALYAYLWASRTESPATIVDWDENTKRMTYKLGNSSSYQVVKMGVETFYKPEVPKSGSSARSATDTLRDVMIGYTFYKAITGGFK